MPNNNSSPVSKKIKKRSYDSFRKMGSKGRIPPPHMRHPLPGPGLVHPDSFGPGMFPHPGPFPPFDMLPPPEITEQKIAAQHVEMQRLGSENQRLAATHGTLRQELAAAQHELQILHAQIGAITSEREQQMKSITDKIAKMQAELKAAEPVKVELQKAHTEAQNLVLAREDLMSKAHQLDQDLQRVHAELQQIPALIAERDSLRQEYQHCRATFDYEKKCYSDHLESLQVMEKNYMTMAREVDKLRAELMNTANVDSRTVGEYGGATGNNENGASGHPVGQNAYEVGYGIHKRHVPTPSAVTGASEGAGVAVYVGAQSGPAPTRTSYEMSRGPGYGISRRPGYDMSRGTSYESHKVPGYDAQRGPSWDGQRGGANDASRGGTFDATAGSFALSHGQPAIPNNGPYGSATAPAHVGGAHEAPPRPGNSARRPYGSATAPAHVGGAHEAPPRPGNSARR